MMAPEAMNAERPTFNAERSRTEWGTIGNGESALVAGPMDPRSAGKRQPDRKEPDRER